MDEHRHIILVDTISRHMMRRATIFLSIQIYLKTMK